MPAQDEPLTVGSIEQITGDRRTWAALKRLAEDKAPPTLAQLVLWHVADGFDWDTIAEMSRGWANPHELTLARSLAERIGARGKDVDVAPEGEAGSIRWELTTRRPVGDPLSTEVREALKGGSMIGLPLVPGIDPRPDGPCLAIRVRLDGPEALIQLAASDETCGSWVAGGKLHVPLTGKDGEPRKGSEVVDQIAQAVLGRVLDVRIVTRSKGKGEASYSISIDNSSPLILNGLSLSGAKPAAAESSEATSCLNGFNLPPRRKVVIPISPEAVDRLGLKSGLRLVAADLSAL
jgi:hypothetical protein